MCDLASLIVPVYNADEHFPTFLRSLFRQTYANIEYVFVDDGSTNDCMAVLASEMAQFPRVNDSVKILRHNTNHGISSSRKTGINAATGKYLAFADQDDLLDDNMVFHLKTLASDYHADVSMCEFTRDMTPNEGNNKPTNIVCLSPSFCMQQALLGRSHCFLWNKLFLRQLFIDNDLNAPEEMTMLEDLHVLYRVFYYAKAVVYCSNPYYHWRNNSKSASHLYSEKINKQSSVLINAVTRMEDFFKENKITDDALMG